ncbi:hypothetical protein R3P38DRAFT_3237408 [Favolaschia claudopus]|uniref:Uncharacterized protein n=1 Tax=Favolaschia claudopus TaxID=2862362 RepID=A0AAV9ZAN6_9AGAR
MELVRTAISMVCLRLILLFSLRRLTSSYYLFNAAHSPAGHRLSSIDVAPNPSRPSASSTAAAFPPSAKYLHLRHGLVDFVLREINSVNLVHTGDRTNRTFRAPFLIGSFILATPPQMHPPASFVPFLIFVMHSIGLPFLAAVTIFSSLMRLAGNAGYC